MQDTSSKGMYSLADLQSKLNTNKDVHGMYKKIEEQSTIKVKKISSIFSKKLNYSSFFNGAFTSVSKGING